MTVVTLCSDLDIQQSHTHGLYYKHIIIKMMTLESSVIVVSLSDNSRGVIYAPGVFNYAPREHL